MKVPTETSLKPSSNTHPEVFRHTLYRFLIVGIGVMLGMTAYEFLKQVLFPEITVWQSHIVTIFFTTGVSLPTAYYVTRKTEIMHVRLSENNVIHRETVAALRLSEEKLSKLLHAIPDWIIISSLYDGCYRDVNDAFCRISGYQKEEVIGNTSSELRIWVDPQEREEMIPILLKEGRINDREVRFRMKSGEVRYMLRSAELFDLEGEKTIISVCKDITERKNSETALKESEERLRLLVKNSSDALVIINVDGTQRYVSPGAERITGFPVEELEGRPIEILIHPDDMKDITEAWNEAIEHPEKTVTVQYRHIHKTQGWVYSEAIAQSFVNEPAIHGVIASVRDVTERKKAEEQLKESEDKFRIMFNYSPDAVNIIRIDDDSYIDINQGFTRATGFTRDEVIGKTSSALNIWKDPADRQRLIDGLREKGYVENLEAQFRRKDGSFLIGLMSTRLIFLKDIQHLISITRDITELKAHESERLKIEKLESIGILAGGIAHDFNNILTGIMGNISFARVFIDTDHKSRKALAEAEKAAGRAGELANQLLTFARGGEPIKKVVSPQDLVNEALSFVLRGSNVKGIVDIPDSIHALDVDEGQIGQVFQNIIINATHAMPGGGVITITAQDELLDDNNTLSLTPGSYLRFSFADQGCGIPEEDLKRIFDPYFTTKSTGTGLGLASAHSIVNRHGGHITAKSEVGKGATFTLYLPSIGQVYKKFKENAAQQAGNKHKGGSILIMDDEKMIREVASSMLAHLGYEVTVCSDGEKAVELFKTSIESGTPYSMVIMDLTIPGGLGGKEAAERILSFYPEACLVVSSGYSNDPIISKYQEYGFRGAIAKPYNINNFKEVVGSLLV